MPICPECSLGIPPTLSACPDCGRHLVELPRVEEPEETEDTFVAAAILAEPTEMPADSMALDEEELLEAEPSLEIVLEAPDPPAAVTAVPEEDSVEEPFPAHEEEDSGDDVPKVADILINQEEDESDEPEEDLEEFLAGAEHFTRLIDTAPRQPLSEQSAPRAKPVRWAHRAYRGDVGVISVSSRTAVTLAVFGDGLLLIESAGAIGGLVPALTGWRSPRKEFSRAGSSSEAEARVKGSRRLATPDIHSVRVAKGGARVCELTIRTIDGKELHYRVASKRYRLLASLLAPVLGAKLRETSKGEKAPRRAG